MDAKRMVFMAAVMAWAALAAGPAQASPLDLRVDFADDNTDPTGNWNIIDTFSGPLHNLESHDDLIDFNTGLDSGIDLDTWGWRRSTQTDDWNPSNPGPTWLDSEKDAAYDYIWDYNGGDATITFSGLDNSKFYDVELICSSNSGTGNQTATYTLDGGFFVISPDGTPSADGRFNHLSQGYEAGQWMTWSNVAPSSGVIEVTMNATGSDRARANAIRLVEVIPGQVIPEPATMLAVLAGAGALGGYVRRRRR
jgi:hypothetical protein